MKKITILLVLFISFISCETLDDSPNENNYVFNENLEETLNEIQLDFPMLIEESAKMNGRFIRLEYLYGENYNDHMGFLNSINSTIWELAYSNLLPKMIEAQAIAEDENAFNHLGVIKTLKAFTLMTLVDIYGDVPYSELLEPNPNLDSGESIYVEALGLLDEAIQDFNSQGAVLDTDYYYNNDFLKWRKLVNTLKMKIYNQSRLVDANAINNFNEIVNSGNYISSIEDDFEFRYANSESIHPNYNSNYHVAGVSSYRSNWITDKMVLLEDPRRRYYFYRQNECTPGNFNENGDFCFPDVFDEAVLLCLEDEQPTHYSEDMAFCSVSHGYWGRDHGYSNGIPPDTFRRTAAGIYPIGGKFDDNDFAPVEVNDGGQGLGITPILLSTWVDFMQAEMALVTNDESSANSFMQTGIQKSFDKVLGFIFLDPDANPSYAPTSAEVTNYINSISDNFIIGDNLEKWNILAEQQFIANYGNGNSPYNFYRRTGFPTSLQFHLNENPGPFIRSI